MHKVLIVGAFSLLSFFSKADADATFGIDDFLALTDLSEIDVSPGGQFVAYTASSTDLEKDLVRDTVWIQGTNGGEAVRMTSPDSDASSPLWSPDGRYLAVLSDRKDETSQVWLFDRRGGDAQQLTDFKQGIESFAWAPDSKSMLLVAEDPSPADLDDEELPNPRPYVVDRLQFKEDYVGYLDRHRPHIHVIDIASRESRQVTFGDFDDSEPAWSPDGQRIVFVSNRTADPDRNRNTDLWIVNVNEKNAAPQRLTTSEVADASPSWSPDGQTIVYTSTVPGALPIYAIPQLTVVNVESGEFAVNAPLAETQVFTPRYTPDGRFVLAITEYHGEQNLVRIDVADGAVQSLVDGRDVVTDFTVSPSGDVYTLVARPQQPDELFAYRDGQVTQLSSVNKAVLDGMRLATVEKYQVGTADGTTIETLVTFPPGFRKGKALPAVLLIHGGPQQQWDYRFDVEAQMLAARGYVVVMPNPRGSWGYGQAYSEAIRGDWGGIDYEDLMAAVDFTIDEGWVDAERLAVYGWSYGGMLTNHVITKTDRFKVAITVASATLYIANYGHDQYQRWWEEELGLPWVEGNREKYDRMSPFYSLNKVKTPTLVIGGEEDWNVPILNSEQLYIVLKRLGVPTELVVYPGQGHVWDVPSYNRDLYERYFVWLQRYLGK